MTAGVASSTVVADSVALDAHRDLAEDPVHSASAWPALLAPGLLLTRTILALTLILAPWLSAFVYVAPGVRAAAAAMMVLHMMGTRYVLRYPQRRVATYVFWSMLGIDALVAGAFLGAAPHLLGPALPLALIVLAMGFAAGGGLALLLCAVGTSLAAAVTTWCEVTAPLVLSTGLSFAPALSLETFFAGAPASGSPGLPTTLSVETVFAGVPVLDRGAPLFVPALAIALIALCVGGAASLLRVRGTLSVVADRAVADS